MKNGLIAIIVAASLMACGKAPEEPKSATQSIPAIEKPRETEPVAVPVPKIEFSNLKDALAKLIPHMSDIHGDGLDKGAAVLALWGADQMKWSELQEIPVGKYGLVMKDPDSQRGKRICTSGTIIEIAVDNTVPQKLFIGGLFDGAGHIYRFLAVGSTGEIIAGSTAKFCGIVTGQQHYGNSGGGVAHAVHLVGIFDLPENKKR